MAQISGGNHPPRTFLTDVPGGEAKAAHEVLAALYAALSGEEEGTLLKDLDGWLAEENPVFKASLSSPDGNRLLPREISNTDFLSVKIDEPPARKPGLELILTDWTFGTEALSVYSRFSRQGETAPRLFMHREDAARLGLADAERVALRTGGQDVVFELAVVSNMATGLIIAPRHRRVKWRELEPWPAVIAEDGIRRV
jgi:NADH-quinone oxidoreductase subunit G